MPRRIFITAAEVSGDKYAGGLAGALRRLDAEIVVEGLGGPAMTAAGVKIHFETTARAAMTFHAVARAREVWRWLQWIKQEYAQRKPDLHVCVDSSGFNLHFAKVARHFGVPVLYYVAPQLWASREGRIKKVRAYVDRVASIFPFEAEWYRQRGVDATFVGHPLFDAIPPNRLELSASPPRYPDRPPVIGIVPGSRSSEVKANLPHLASVMQGLRSAFPAARFMIPTIEDQHANVCECVSRRDRALYEASTIWPDFDWMIPQCDLVITKSGTSTVHVAAYGVPMIVVYRINRFAWHLAGRWLVKTKKIAMVNILAGQTELVPEFIPWYGGVTAVTNCALDLLRHPQKLAEQRRKLIELIEPISHPGASVNVARMAMEMMR